MAGYTGVTGLIARHTPFVIRLAESQAADDFREVEANLPKLEAIVAATMEPQYEPGGLELRAREIRQRHEFPADGRPLRP